MWEASKYLDRDVAVVAEVEAVGCFVSITFLLVVVVN